LPNFDEHMVFFHLNIFRVIWGDRNTANFDNEKYALKKNRQKDFCYW